MRRLPLPFPTLPASMPRCSRKPPTPPASCTTPSRGLRYRHDG
jgi:hypothetical protein